MRFLGSIVLLLISQYSIAQLLSTWPVGNGMLIRFHVDSIQIDTISFSSPEGFSVFSNAQHQTDLICNGEVIINSKGNAISGGVGLYGNTSSTQSSLFIPIQSDTSQILVFTTDELGKGKGLQMHKIQNIDGNYATVFTNELVLNNVAEKLTAIQFEESTIVAGIHILSNSIFLIEINKLGEIVSTSYFPLKNKMTVSPNNQIGQMKFSSDGKHLAFASYGANTVECYQADLNQKTIGELEYEFSISNPYGIEFCRNSKELFVSTWCMNDSSFVIKHQLGSNSHETLSASSSPFGSLQLSPYGNIWASRVGLPYYSFIQQSEFHEFGFFLGDWNIKLPAGLPNLIQGVISEYQTMPTEDCPTYQLLTDTTICMGQSFQLPSLPRPYLTQVSLINSFSLEEEKVSVYSIQGLYRNCSVNKSFTLTEVNVPDIEIDGTQDENGVEITFFSDAEELYFNSELVTKAVRIQKSGRYHLLAKFTRCVKQQFLEIDL